MTVKKRSVLGTARAELIWKTGDGGQRGRERGQEWDLELAMGVPGDYFIGKAPFGFFRSLAC